MSEKQAADVSRRIKQLRARLGVSQRGLAHLMGVSALSVLRWEQGQAHPHPLAWRQFAESEATNAGPSVLHLRPAADPPLQLTSFIGRESELVPICQLVTTARLVTLTGAGGCGKTRLALGVAGALNSAFADGVWYVELGSLADPRLLPQTIASIVGLREDASRTLLDRVAVSLRDRQLLLVLDNCEHLLEACANLADTVLKACPDVHILATSREALA